MVRASVRGLVEADPNAVYAFLADLRNHWRLARRHVSVDEVERSAEPGGAWIRVRGPLGISRRADTRIVRSTPPEESVGGVLDGAVRTRGGTCASVVWSLAAAPGGTFVTIELGVESATAADRALLALGGRRWLERRLLRDALDDLRATVVAGEL